MAWILQGNPKNFDFDMSLSRTPNYFYWRTPTHRKEFKLGDPVFIWRAGKESGVVASGKIAELPVSRDKVKHPQLLNNRIWKGKSPDQKEVVVGIEVDDLRLSLQEGMISRRLFESDPVLQNCAIIKMPRRTVFRLTPEEESIISSWWFEGAYIEKSNFREIGGMYEAAIIERLHRRRERSRKLRADKILHFLKEHGSLYCEICQDDYKAKYPAGLEKSVFQVHHIVPLSQLEVPQRTELADLMVVCANCHSLIHSSMDVEGNTKLIRDKFGA